MRHVLIVLLPFAAIACSDPGPGERAGRAVDRAATRTGEAVGDAARGTGSALERAGNWVGDRVDPPRR